MMNAIIVLLIILTAFYLFYSTNARDECGKGINLCDVQFTMKSWTKCTSLCNGSQYKYTSRCCGRMRINECLQACNMTRADLYEKRPCSYRCIYGLYGIEGRCVCHQGYVGQCCDICNSGWSPWINEMHPATYGLGDKEKSAKEYQNSSKFCFGGNITKLECWTVDTNVSLYASEERVSCSLEKGFVCENADNFPIPCQDYKIRYWCECRSPLVTTGQHSMQKRTTIQQNSQKVNIVSSISTTQPTENTVKKKRQSNLLVILLPTFLTCLVFIAVVVICSILYSKKKISVDKNQE